MSDRMMNLELIDCEEMNVHTVVDKSIQQSYLSNSLLSFSAEQGAICLGSVNIHVIRGQWDVVGLTYVQ